MTTSIKAEFTRLLLGTIVLLLISSIPFLPRTSFAQIPGIGSTGETPYGGLNTVPIYCSCSNTFFITLWDYTDDKLLKLIYQPGASVLYEYYLIYGTYLLGTYRQGGTCQIYAGTGCISLTAQGLMGSEPGTGTSL